MKAGPTDLPVRGTRSRADLAERLVSLGYSSRRATALVTSVFGLIADGLVDDGEVKLAGFGRFAVVDRAPRPARDLRTGAAIPVGTRRTVTFRTSPAFRASLTAALEAR